MKRVYCNGLSKATLKLELDKGFVLTDFVRGGYSGGDVAYFREGSPDELDDLRRKTASWELTKEESAIPASFSGETP